MSQKLYNFTLRHDPYPAVDPFNPANSVHGRNVVVTGAGAGVGLAISEAFAQAGAANLVVIARTVSKLNALAADLRSKYKTKIHVLLFDLRSPTGCGEQLNVLANEFGKFDVLVLNASYLHQPAEINSLDVAEWWRSFETNVRGNMLITQAFIPHARPNASVICITSFMSYLPAFPYRVSGYAGSKSAFETVLRYLHEEERPELRFFCVHPGTVKTDMMLKCGVPGDADDFIWYDDPMLAGGFCVWLCGEHADFLNGRTVEAMWDVDDLVAIKDDILKDPSLFTLGLNGRGPFPLTKS